MAHPSGETTPGLGLLPAELHMHVLSLLPPNDLALGGRLSCKDAAQRFSQPHHRTARLSQPLPGHAVTAAGATTATWCVEAAQTALRELTFRRKLLLPSTAAASGCEANVEFALQLLQPHVFPEALQTDHYLTYLKRWTELQVPDAGSAAVASGLARLLPSLAQRCPGLLDPGATLEAAARHCDLAGLQAAWEAVGQRLFSILDRAGDPEQGGGADHQQQQQEARKAPGVWRRMLSAAAGSPCPDAESKMAWVLDKARVHGRLGVEHAEVWGAAAPSGDLARLRWLRERGFPWGGAEALAAVLRQADLPFIVRMEQEGGYLPAAGDEWWGSEAAVCAAAGSARDSVAKLRWLAGRGAALGSVRAVQAAAARGDLAAVQLLVGHWRGQGAREAEQPAVLLHSPILAAVESGSVATASWLLQQGFGLDARCFVAAIQRGNLTMLRWLLQAGCPREPLQGSYAVFAWPANTAADVEALVEAVQLLAAEGWPLESEGDVTTLQGAAIRHPWAVLRALLGLRSEPGAGQLPQSAVLAAAIAGCEATLEAMVAMRASEANPALIECNWYDAAGKKRDRGMLTCLRRLGVPLRAEVLPLAARYGAPLFLLQWLVEQGSAIPCSTVIKRMLGWLNDGYPAPREQERRQVEAWLRGLRGKRQKEERGRGKRGRGLGWLCRCCIRGTGTV